MGEVTLTRPSFFQLWVPGHPEPAGSKRALPIRGVPGERAIVVDANRKSTPWKKYVHDCVIASPGWGQIEGPLELHLDFVLRRPQGHYGTGKNSESVRASAPGWPAVKPDVLKLARGVEDALTGLLYRDDAQIVREQLSKSYGPVEGVQIELYSLLFRVVPSPCLSVSSPTPAVTVS